MKKTITILIAIILLLLIIAIGIYHTGTYKETTNFKVTYLPISLEEKNSNFENVNILYISDLEFGKYFDSNKLTALSNKISSLDFDLFLFGGDIFDEDFLPVVEDVETVTTFFKNIKCDLGKFAIYGDYDLINETRNLLAKKVLNDSQIEVLNGDYKIYNGTNYSFINLVGLPYDENNFESEIDNDYLTLSLLHNYEQVSLVNNKSDLVICGNTHKHQINILKQTDYKLGLHANTYITNGVGLTKTATRIFSSPEIVLITLKK